MIHQLRYLLIQIRNDDDPMREHELSCFSRALGCPPENFAIHDLIKQPLNVERFEKVDAVLIGGSGDYSVAEGGPWLPAALDAFVMLYDTSKPTFASCWGVQAFARALGGKVVTDLNRAELGTLPLTPTTIAKQDPVFGQLSSPFLVQLGHQDIVDELPRDAVLLASSDRVENEAFTFPGKLIYGTQFHPELNRDDLINRIERYPVYLQKITGLSPEQFQSQCQETPESEELLRRFAELVASRAASGFVD